MSQPEIQDQAFLSLRNESPSLLRAPFASYSMFKTDFREQGVVEQIAEKLKVFPQSRVTCIIADSLYGSGKHAWDSAALKWGQKDYEDVFKFASYEPLTHASHLLL